jgi:hypothetical protein
MSTKDALVLVLDLAREVAIGPTEKRAIQLVERLLQLPYNMLPPRGVLPNAQSKVKRNMAICAAYNRGMAVPKIAAKHEMSTKRVYAILARWSKAGGL